MDTHDFFVVSVVVCKALYALNIEWVVALS